MIFVLLFVTATFRPASPTVGDLVTIDFQTPVALEASAQYEIVSQRGNRVVIRTFEPKPVAVSGTTGGVHFAKLMIPVRSVLKPKDKLEPAPLRPPVSVPWPRLPFVLVGVSSLVAAIAWIATVMLARRKQTVVEVEAYVDPAERFRRAVALLRAQPARAHRWADLADATRVFLASLSPHLGVELTTSQLLPRVDEEHLALVGQILRQGDLEKFSPWGAPAGDFDEFAARAVELIPPPREEESAAA
ncbi:MAG TPA: hypothetical protein VLU46_06935 [Thermoanaerobaculia bacterium]|nr:hypothetical protein [Thermoanaerobaculia bacterium]